MGGQAGAEYEAAQAGFSSYLKGHAQDSWSWSSPSASIKELAPFPLAAAPLRWDDPFSELDPFESSFSLAPSLTALTRSLAGLPESLRSVARVDVSVDEQTNMLTIKAQNAAGTLRQNRVVMLPCSVQRGHKITAEHFGNRVVVTVPEESQVKPRAGQELSTPLKISLRPAELPRNAIDASEITAKITEDRGLSCSFKRCLVVSVPKDALEPERKTVKQKIAVQKALAAAA
ncbi:hypothetical protein T492DRAFT_834190 [Pavlovales sp. CCMP2436]|nr:hypothetical protein T492DRAFT_834190 [Pavlovales sp. CCMP2436]